ncbi:tRNA (guanine-n -)-methyltransferase [Colletotrichum truncatum]|uniref:tRNA (Guanine-n -)-methyltransferase n=1 Tax=Colletotrichum truncatum TaxID=5467 RepID=A0ACC3Z6A9_COLTU|nr:tRNA (guanine-n -)-methyltransferase [Colletotrichum truncatum]KAF6788121.1 tRNA (guanine-n -)-methyltransferase [Colletotrichum truncatum]
MASTTTEPVGQPAKDLEMTDVKQDQATVPSTVLNGDEAVPSGGVEQAEGPQPAATSCDSTEPNDQQGQGSNNNGDEPKVSKNQLRKMKRKAAWEEGREDRKRKRKDKRADRQAARREQIAAIVADAEAKGLDPSQIVIPPKRKTPKVPATQVPVSLILDCDFEKYMMEKELISLASQITRCYSDNRNARYRAHLYISSYGGKLKQRFETTLAGQHTGWKGVKLVEGNFIEAAKDAGEVMSGDRGGEVIELLKSEDAEGAPKKPAVSLDVYDNAPTPAAEPEPIDELKNIVYLSADSVNTLDRLEPGVSYVIGGLVDRNREKYLCHRRARALGVRTAKLPIGEYMNISSKRVLATNHVVEIMLKWLESGDWAEAFTAVIPKRKEAKLKGEVGSASGTPAAETGEGEEEDDVEDSRFEEEHDEDIDEKQTITENVKVSQPEAEPRDEKTKEAESVS